MKIAKDIVFTRCAMISLLNLASYDKIHIIGIF